MVKKRSLLARRQLFRNTVAGTETLPTAQTTGTDTQQTAETLLAGLNLSEDQLKALKTDSSLLSVVSGLVESKRKANGEAKTFREELERAKNAQTENERKQQEEQGKYKELYEKSKAQLDEQKSSFTQERMKFKIEALAAKEGIESTDYLKLFDTSSLKLDENGAIEGLNEKFAEFKKTYPKFFSSEIVQPANGRPILNNSAPDSDVQKIKETAIKNPSTQNIAAAWSQLKQKK